MRPRLLSRLGARLALLAARRRFRATLRPLGAVLAILAAPAFLL